MTVPYDIVADILRVLTVISQGKVPTVACDECGVSYTTFTSYTKKYPQLADLRTEAEDRLYDQMAEALPRIFDHPIYGQDEAARANTVSSNIKWLLERRRSKSYGQHSVIEHTITADREVLDALQRAKARAQGGDFDNLVKEKMGEILDLTVFEGVAQALPNLSNASADASPRTSADASPRTSADASPRTSADASPRTEIEDPFDISSIS